MATIWKHFICKIEIDMENFEENKSPNRDRSRRRRTLSIAAGGRGLRPISLTGRNDTMTLSETIAAGPPSAAEGFPIEMAMAETYGPWRRDRITLTLEAQALLMEMRVVARDVWDFASQTYSNLVSQLRIAVGRMVKLESFGGYRLLWKN